MGVWQMFVFGHQFAIDANVEFPVGPGDQLETFNLIADAAQGFACHPGSSQCVLSIVAVEYLYF